MRWLVSVRTAIGASRAADSRRKLRAKADGGGDGHIRKEIHVPDKESKTRQWSGFPPDSYLKKHNDRAGQQIFESKVNKFLEDL